MATSMREPRPLTGFLIWRVSMKWRAAIDRALAPLGLTHAQYALLGSLYGLSRAGARPSQRELADYSGLEAMYVSKLARALERSGLLEREPNPDDPRAFHLTLTARGLETMTVAFATVGDVHERLISPLGEPGDPRRAELRTMLETLLQYTDRPDGLDPSDANEE